MAEGFNESRFRQQVSQALEAARRVLENTKRPQLPEDVSHLYGDKYILAEGLANSALAAVLNALELLGLNPRTFRQAREWGVDRSVTLRLKAEERCEFNREETREVESSKYVRDYGVGKITDKVVTTIHEWFWDFSYSYSLIIYPGNEPDEGLVLQTRTGKMELMTTTKDAPRPKVVVRDGLDLNFGFLLRHINAENRFAFKIDRSAAACHTPRRNAEIISAIGFVLELGKWAHAVDSYFRNEIFPIQTSQGGVEKLGLSALNLKNVFCPVLPLFMRQQGTQEATPHQAHALAALGELDASKVKMTLGDLNRFLDEQKRSISEKFTDLTKVFPDGVKLITVAEANIVIVALHLASVGEHFVDGVNYIEELIRKQLIAAIGKVVTPVDFQNYMLYHNDRIFREEYRPRAFSYAIRRPDHYPEGILSIEGHLADGTMSDPIRTIVSCHRPESPMHFSISASAKVAFKGDVYLHGHVGHQFAGDSGMRMTLNARARQFSSFLVLVGRISGPGLFDPQFGMICQNKDDFQLPLDLETIPTPKEFRDAIESLSPEQQAFCKLYRGMQLSSTLFGVLVLQIKPQMEKVLKMANDSLTKEIRLTQELISLFLEYQIPSDLLSFAGLPSASKEEKLQGVKANVEAMNQMIANAKKKEIAEVAQEAQIQMLESIAVAPLQKSMVPRAPAPMSARSGGAPPPPPSSAPRMAMMSAPPPSAPMMMMSAPPPPAPAPVVAATPAPPPPAVVVEQSVVSNDVGGDQQTLQASTKFDSGSSGRSDVDFTKLPQELDSKFEKLDLDAALRPTILNVGKHWTKKFQENLLSGVKQKGLNVSDQKLERNSCFDLLDALTNSGCIPFDDGQLHIVMASTHCFADNLMNTLVKDNMNPIEKLERSELIVATTIHRKRAEEMLVPDQVDRIREFSAGNVMSIES